MTFTEWIDSLTEPQQRALGYQAGIAGYMTYPLAKLIGRLKESDVARKHYADWMAWEDKFNG
jgi:hypothetical protein